MKFAAACAVAVEASQRAFTPGQIWNPYPTHYRSAFAFCFFLCPLHDHLHSGECPLIELAMDLAVMAVHRVYLVSQGAHPAGMPDDGVRDVLSAGCARGNEL